MTPARARVLGALVAAIVLIGGVLIATRDDGDHEDASQVETDDAGSTTTRPASSTSTPTSASTSSTTTTSPSTTDTPPATSAAPTAP
ncbi:MAG: hypothetical protein ACJ739_13215, partial [Acidimicrobiales bacterium]